MRALANFQDRARALGKDELKSGAFRKIFEEDVTFDKMMNTELTNELDNMSFRTNKEESKSFARNSRKIKARIQTKNREILKMLK